MWDRQEVYIGWKATTDPRWTSFKNAFGSRGLRVIVLAPLATFVCKEIVFVLFARHSVHPNVG